MLQNKTIRPAIFIADWRHSVFRHILRVSVHKHVCLTSTISASSLALLGRDCGLEAPAWSFMAPGHTHRLIQHCRSIRKPWLITTTHELQ